MRFVHVIVLATAATLVGDTLPGASINEIRIDQSGEDLDEFFELNGSPGESLDDLTYIVIGDSGSGVVECVIDLSGQSIPGDGFFVAAEGSFSLGVPDLTVTLAFENNDNVTHLLVRGFTGSLYDDLDLDDDCVLDSTPWTEIVDGIALIEEDNPPSGTECHYGNLPGVATLGPDGLYPPAAAARCPDGTGQWMIGDFDTAAGSDSPGSSNIDRCLVFVDGFESGDTRAWDRHRLTVEKDGIGDGTVTSDPTGIDCGPDCTGLYPFGTTITLSASPISGHQFVGWSGDCLGSGDCVVSMTGERSVTATFECTATFTIAAVETVSLDYGVIGHDIPGTDLWALESPPEGWDVTGWAGFNVSGVPDGLNLTEITLFVYRDATSSIYGNPVVRVYYSTANNWNAGGANVGTVPRTLLVSSSFTSFSAGWNALSINVAARDWSADLADNWITLGVEDISTTSYNWVRFRGADLASYRPYLVVVGTTCE